MSVRIAPFAQGLFFVATGAWPIIHLRSFEAVTGRKRDKWLVQTIGGLITAVGVALLAGATERKSRSLKTLGIASSAALGAADVVFAGQGRISPVYFADAAVEAAIVAAWLASE